MSPEQVVVHDIGYGQAPDGLRMMYAILGKLSRLRSCMDLT